MFHGYFHLLGIEIQIFLILSMLLLLIYNNDRSTVVSK